MTNAAKNWTICTLAASLLVVAGLSASIVQAERQEKHQLISRLERQERKVTVVERRQPYLQSAYCHTCTK